MEPIVFTLKDADGVEHTYRMLPHGGTEGYAITAELFGLCSGPLGSVLIALMAGAAAPSDAMLSLDVEALGRALRGALAEMPKLTAKILRHTTRDDQKLSNVIVFDAAYERNYWEANLAVWEVVRHNRFLPPFVTSLLEKRTPRAGARELPAP